MLAYHRGKAVGDGVAVGAAGNQADDGNARIIAQDLGGETGRADGGDGLGFHAVDDAGGVHNGARRGQGGKAFGLGRGNARQRDGQPVGLHFGPGGACVVQRVPHSDL